MRHESLFFLFSQVTRIKGVGLSTAKNLQRLFPAATQAGSLPTVRDMLFHLPVGLVDRRHTFPLSHIPKEPQIATFVVTVDEHIPPKQKRYGKQPYKVLCSNDTGTLTLVFFHARDDYVKQALPVGAKRVVSGRVELFDFQAQMTHPDIIAPAGELASVQRQEPVYPLTVGLTSRRIARIVSDALDKLPDFPEWITAFPAPLAGKECLSFKSALIAAHNPQTQEDLLPAAPARMRLAYDEMLANQLHLAMLRAQTKKHTGEKIEGTGTLTESLKKSLPFALTKGQEQVLEEIYADIASDHRMTRLLQGDVGSGKTIVALFAMLRTIEQGAQAALMAPTELIAQQHYEVITKLLAAINPSPLKGVELITLLTGNIKGAARKEALEKIKSGEAGIIIGTHALFQEQVGFKNLALVVIDEQHRFGVAQRMALSAKGNNPHILHMTATPIPRSLAMTLYGDMDVSQLTEKPAARKPIVTRVIPASRYEEVIDRLKAALGKGEKAYWICPLIEDEVDGKWLMVDGEEKNPSTINHQLSTDLAAAKSRHTEFTARFGPIVGLVHGRMKADERDKQMEKFASGETKLLVATTVVEVGVDVRDATIIVIEKAERFGLSQLHQLRGRVGRGDKPSACVLLYDEGIREQALGISESSDPQSPMPNASLARLSVLRDTEDGFKIAEADLAQRGAGELLGVRQSGLPKTIFVDLGHHQALIAKARDEAIEILKKDPEFSTSNGQAAMLLLQLFCKEFQGISPAKDESAAAQS